MPEEEPARPATEPPSTIPPSRFVVVSESELDPLDEEEKRPVFSWQTGALVAALLLVGLSVWWFLQPPTADSLFKRITAITADGSIGSIRQAEPYIRDFLYRYSDDHRAAKLRTYEQELELDDLQRKFDSPIKRLTNRGELGSIGRLYSEAMNYVQLDPEQGMKKLQAIVDLYGRPEHGGSSSEPFVVLAKRRLAQLREESRKKAGEQLELLQNRLAAADALRPSDAKRAEAMYRAVIELYGDKPWAADAVGRAREALKTPPK